MTRKQRRRLKVRDPNAAPAFRRKAGPMKHRNEPRGGARNTQHEYTQDELEQSILDDFDCSCSSCNRGEE